MGIWYATRGAVKAATQNTTSRDDALVDREIEAASRAVEGFLLRRFYPWTGTKLFPWPGQGAGGSYRLWLDSDEAISVSAMTVDNGATVIDPASIYLEPVNDGPPYNRVEIDQSASGAFSSGRTPQRAVALTGVFGSSADERTAGALASSPNASTTTWDVTDSTLADVGDLLRCGSERVQVVGRTWLDATLDLQADLAAQKNAVTFAVTDGTLLREREMLLIDGERMLVQSIAGNTVTVERACDGSVLALHSAGAGLYAPRRLTVERGQAGTTAAAHTAADVLYANKPPADVTEFVVALAAAVLNQLGGAMASESGQGETRRSTNANLDRLRTNLINTWGRIRTGAV